MKKITIVLLLAVTLFGNSSCDKFLEESSPDLIRPVSVTHFKELLQGEGYFKEFSQVGWFVDVMSDDMNVIAYPDPVILESSKLKDGHLAYKWAPNIEHVEGKIQDRLFRHLYKNILTANVILEEVPKITGDDKNRDVLLGQAYFHRAYGYFVLANLYAQAYNESAANDLCVPLILAAEPSLKKFPRASIKEIWDLIRADVTKSVDLLAKDEGIRSVYEVNYKAALLLASRVFLYTQDYDKVIDYGEQFLALKANLQNITAIQGSPTIYGFASGVFLRATANEEVVFTFSRMQDARAPGSYLSYTRDNTLLSEGTFSASSNVSRGLIDTYSAKDKRKSYWFAEPDPNTPGIIVRSLAYSPLKNFNKSGDETSQFMRSAEVYLNVAEAYALKGSPDTKKALALLNVLRVNRIENYSNMQESDFASAVAFKEFLYEERRRELCFEEFHRWWDLRRTGQPALEHAYLGKTYRLAKKDPAYILNFPQEEIDFNTALEENYRPERLPN